MASDQIINQAVTVKSNYKDPQAIVRWSGAKVHELD